MSKFSQSSFGRDLPRRDPPRMGPGMANPSSGFGRSGQGPSRVGNLMDMGSSSRMGPQRSPNPPSSSQNIPSIFRLGSRGQGSSQPSREPDHASRVLASFGLSSIDLDELSRFPEEKITAENLPEIIQHLKRKRSEHMEMISNRERLSRDSMRPSSDNWDDLRPLRRGSFDDHPAGDFGRSGNSRDMPFRDRMDMDDRDRERLRDDRFLSDSEFNRMGFGPLQERSGFDKPRGIPSARKIDDFHGLPPKDFPYLCSLCDLSVNNFQNWDDHLSGRLHKRQCLLLLDLYPEWNPRRPVGDSFIPPSTNPAPGILGPPPPPMPMGGPNQRGNLRGPPGHDDMPGPGPRHLPQPRPGTGRVVHIVGFERGRTLKQELLNLVQPFGKVTNMLILNNLNEAFIEMANAAQAVAAVVHYEMNPAYVYGDTVRVFLSQKYKQIKKDDTKKPTPKSETKTESKSDSKSDSGSVLRICNLPPSGYTETAVVKLAETYGKVKNYILMRMRNQIFIEMEKAEDAQAMINRSAKSPLFFQGRALTVGLSQKYKKLVLRIPKNTDDADKKTSRKRAHSPDKDGKDPKEKQKKSEGDEGDDKGEVVTSEEADELVSGCEPELAEDEDEEATSALLEGASGDEAELLEESDLNQNGSEPLSSTPEKRKGVVTLDDIRRDNNESRKKRSKNSASAEEGEQQDVVMEESTEEGDKTADSQSGEEPAIVEVGPYQVNNPVGVDFVIPKTGFYCKLCSLFYTTEDVAKVTHCSTLAHYKKYKAYYNKAAKNVKKKAGN